jgi:hypothetical protein
MSQPVSGSPDQIAEYLVALGEHGFEEVRCDLWPKTTDAIQAMEPVVKTVHRG